jgi:hypothetical protein
MPFQPGNQHGKTANHARPKLFRDALLAELKRADNNVERIQKVAAKLVDNALNGETAAIKEIADRIDGKVPQGITGDADGDPIRMIHKIERVIVDPENPDGKGVPPAA